MTKSTTKTTKVSAVFLAAVLVAGTMALISPSFMVGAQAAPDYGMSYEKESKYEKPYEKPSMNSYEKEKPYEKPYMKSYDKPKYPSYKPDYSKDKKSVDIKKIKCNNINVNLNDISVDLGIPFNGPFDSAPVAEAEEQVAASGLGNGPNNGGNNGFKKIDKDGFVFICINNNNNAGGGGIPPVTPEDCEDCFLPTNEGGFLPPPFIERLNDYLAENTVPVGNEEDVNSIAELCQAIEAVAGTQDEVTEQELRDILNAAFPGNSNPAAINRVIACLEDLELITSGVLTE